MSLMVGCLGWVAAAALGARARTRAELGARACHELRSPLTAARLALEAGHGPGTVELQLRRLGLAVDDLAAARRGGRAEELVEVVEAGELLDGVRASWAPVAAGLDVRLSVDGPGC